MTRPPTRILAYSASLAFVALAAACAYVLTGFSLPSVWTVAALAIVAALAERGTVRVGRAAEQSISLLPTLFAAVLFGPLAGGIVGASSMLGDPELTSPASPGRWPRLKWITYTSTRFMTGSAMGLTAAQALELVPTRFGGVVLAALSAALVGEALDVALAALTAKARGINRTWEIVRGVVPLLFVAAPLYAPIVAILTVAYQDVSPWTMPLFFVPALAAQRLYALYQEQRELAAELSLANAHLERANISFATALVTTLDARDRYTAGHSAAVAIYSRDIAARLGLNDDDQRIAHLCGLVHDIGKVGLPAGLLEKPGPLTLDERRQMQEHSVIGERILAKVNDYVEVARVVRHHHERVDGHGYPDGLCGSEIPLLSRIIAVADAYNAMTSHRPYREAMPSRVARLRLAQAVESQFDTGVVAAFEAVLAGAAEDYRDGTRQDFRFGLQVRTSDGATADAVADVA